MHVSRRRRVSGFGSFGGVGEERKKWKVFFNMGFSFLTLVLLSYKQTDYCCEPEDGGGSGMESAFTCLGMGWGRSMSSVHANVC
jgi:hypothetical protein